MPVSCQPARTQPGPAYTSDCTSAATSYTAHALSIEPVPTQSAFTGPTATQPALTLAQHALTVPRPAMSLRAMHECTPAMPVHTIVSVHLLCLDLSCS